MQMPELALDGETGNGEVGCARDKLLFILTNPSLKMVSLLSHHLNLVKF